MNPTPPPSTLQWPGSKPQRFKGGRNHNNHPPNQLDNVFISNIKSQQKFLGPSLKKFQNKNSLDKEVIIKPHLRTNGMRNNSNVIFTAQQIPKLIKLPPPDQYKYQNSILFRKRNYGESKLKNLFNGHLTTGIYRNFSRNNIHGNHKFYSIQK